LNVERLVPQRRCVWFLAVLLIGIAGCESNHAPSTAEPAPRRLSVPQAAYFGLTWIDDKIVLNWDPTADAFHIAGELWVANSDGQFRRLSLPNNKNCPVTVFQQPTLLPDGRLGFLNYCPASTPRRSSLLAYDFKTTDVQPLTGGTFVANPSSYAWAPSMTRGLLSESSGICAGIESFTSASVAPFPIWVGQGDQRFRVDEPLVSPDRCAETGRADMPALSPTSDKIAFLASPQSVSLRGRSRLMAPWNLYLVPDGQRQGEPMLGDLTNPSGLAWSPNGEMLAFSATVPLGGPGRGCSIPTPGIFACSPA
jgi:hypothetical protein